VGVVTRARVGERWIDVSDRNKMQGGNNRLMNCAVL
jgi:hypothetical protein